MKLAITINVDIQLNGVAVLNLDTLQKVATEWAAGVLTDKQHVKWEHKGASYEVHAGKAEVFVKPSVSL
jgi:hypothetical protein